MSLETYAVRRNSEGRRALCRGSGHDPGTIVSHAARAVGVIGGCRWHRATSSGRLTVRPMLLAAWDPAQVTVLLATHLARRRRVVLRTVDTASPPAGLSPDSDRRASQFRRVVPRKSCRRSVPARRRQRPNVSRCTISAAGAFLITPALAASPVLPAPVRHGGKMVVLAVSVRALTLTLPVQGMGRIKGPVAVRAARHARCRGRPDSVRPRRRLASRRGRARGSASPGDADAVAGAACVGRA